MAAEEKENCSIGTLLAIECHKGTYSTKKELIGLESINQEEQILLSMRSGCQNIANVCYHHKQIFLTKYETHQKTCCNPFEDHTSSKKKGIRCINNHLYESGKKIGLTLIPGRKICPTCRSKIKTLIVKQNEHSESETETETEEEIAELETSIDRETDRHELATCFSSVGVSPLKLHSLGESSKASSGKRKLSTVISNIKSKVAKTLNIEPGVFEDRNHIEKEQLENVKMFDNLINQVIEKYKSLENKTNKIQVLTLAPDEGCYMQYNTS